MKTGSLADRLFVKFESRILSGEWQPGSRLPAQKDIASSEAVSRTVVREAVARLEAQGYAVARQGDGVFVADSARYRAFQVTRDEMADIGDVVLLLEMRLAFETEMAALAAMRRSMADVDAMQAALAHMHAVSADPAAAAEADAQFHLTIAKASKNPYFIRFCEFLGVRLVPPRELAFRADPGAGAQEYASLVDAQHVAIVDAIARLDVEGARAAARRHMQESLARHIRLADGSHHSEQPIKD
ncbi:FadR/GntR family transcriptional regulator [Sphingomonas sp. FW199]|uniref:FadR/GntR family transcriptional regulator n=1 Tax=Sphingomonas sp. FW199 TaxID=3400217 RepID=UPI003CEE9D06